MFTFCSGSIDLTSCLPVTLLHQIHLLYLICFSTISRPKRTISFVIYYTLNSGIVFDQLTASFGNRFTGFRSVVTINNLPALIDTGNSSNELLLCSFWFALYIWACDSGPHILDIKHYTLTNIIIIWIIKK